MPLPRGRVFTLLLLVPGIRRPRKYIQGKILRDCQDLAVYRRIWTRLVSRIAYKTERVSLNVVFLKLPLLAVRTRAVKLIVFACLATWTKFRAYLRALSGCGTHRSGERSSGCCLQGKVSISDKATTHKKNIEMCSGVTTPATGKVHLIECSIAVIDKHSKKIRKRTRTTCGPAFYCNSH